MADQTDKKVEEVKLDENSGLNRPENVDASDDTQPLDSEEAVIEDTVSEEEIKDKSARFAFNVGDTISVHYRITEGSKSRVQPYEGIVIAKKGSGNSKTFTVRRISVGNVGVERIFPLYSPNIENIVIKHKGKVRRAKLYYLRDKVGKAATKVKSAVKK